MGVFMSPFAWSTFVQMLSKNRPKLNTQTMRPYTITSCTTSGDGEEILA